MSACKRCGGEDFGWWVSRTGRMHRYCRAYRRERARAYSERKRRNGGSHTPKQWLEKLATFDRCPGCGLAWTEIRPRPDRRYRSVITKDHIIPLGQGGSDDIGNLQPLCYVCNFRKCDGRA